MAIKIFSADFQTRTHKNQPRFWVSKKIADMFGFKTGSNIRLIIYSERGRILFSGIHKLKSGLEIYGEACEGLTTSQLIHVQVSRPSQDSYPLIFR